MIDKNTLYNDNKTIFDYCLTLKLSSFHFKEEWDAYVLMVDDKLYGIISIHNEQPIIILKGVPEENEFLCNTYESITPGYHMNKTHWITILLDNTDFTHVQMNNFIKQSYQLVIDKFSKKKKVLLGLD